MRITVCPSFLAYEKIAHIAPLDSVTPSKPSLWEYIKYTFVPICVVLMLIWPWIFFGVLWRKPGHGSKMNGHLAKYVTDNPHTTNFVVTFIASLGSLVISILVSMAVVRLSRTWIARKGHQETHPTIFQVSLLSGFKHHTVPWGFSDRGALFVKKRVFLFLLVVVWMFIFTAVTPAITSLISPIPFTRTDSLTGTEIDFTSNVSECVNWFDSNTIDDTAPCDWVVICSTYGNEVITLTHDITSPLAIHNTPLVSRRINSSMS